MFFNLTVSKIRFTKILPLLLIQLLIGSLILTLGSPLIAKADETGVVYAWGYNTRYQLGNTGPTRNTPITVQLPAGVTGFTKIVSGHYFNIALDSAGRAYGWGFNGYGQLGVGDNLDKSQPTPVVMPAGVNSFVAIAAAYNHSFGIGDDGRVYAWGENVYGKLGDGTTTNRNVPVAVNLPQGVTFVAAAGGYSHSLVLSSTGQVYAWGYNLNGAVGDNSCINRTLPVPVTMPNGLTVKTIDAGVNHSIAIASNGLLYAWGDSGSGQLGIGQYGSRCYPIKVQTPTDATNFTTVVTNGYHNLALAGDGRLYAWGENGGGQLGIGNNTRQLLPVLVNLPQGVTNFTTIEAGMYHSLLIGNNGLLYAMGTNSSGQVGDNTYTNRNLPTLVSLPQGVYAHQLSAGDAHSVVITYSTPL